MFLFDLVTIRFFKKKNKLGVTTQAVSLTERDVDQRKQRLLLPAAIALWGA